MWDFVRWPLAAVSAAVSLILLIPGSAFAAQGLPRTYTATAVSSPSPVGAGRFGVALVNAGDLNGDGKDDILVGTDEHGGAFAGTVYVISGADGSTIKTLPPPDPGGSGNGSAWGGYVGRIGHNAASAPFDDIGSCPGFTGTPSQTCTSANSSIVADAMGPADGIPDLLITALGVDVTYSGGTYVDAGRAYVVDGATGAVLKRLDMPDADLVQEAAISGPPKLAFGRTILAPAGQPPCAGNMGVGTCQTLPPAVKSGDLQGGTGTTSCSSGGNCPDIVVSASDVFETGTTANPQSDCGSAPGNQCLQAGRSYIYNGESIAGSNTTTVNNTPNTTIKNPAAQADDLAATTNHNRENLGYSIEPIGDVGKCNLTHVTVSTEQAGEYCQKADTSPDSTITPDGKPDVVISSHRTDDFGMWDAGVALLIDGASGTVLATYRHPEPQPASLFAFSNYNQPAVGDMGSGSNPDSYEAAMRENNPFTGGGKGYLMNGNFLQAGSPNGISFATLTDPTPHPSEDFGTSSAGIGNVAGLETSLELDDSHNEVLVGAYGPHNPGTDTTEINDAHIFSALNEQELQRLTSPDQQLGAGFGDALAPIGDVNGDGFLDYAIGEGQFDDTVSNAPVTDAGRIYLFKSDNSPAPPAPSTGGPPTGPQGPQGPAGAAAVSQAGRVVDLAANRGSVRRGKRVKLSGDVDAFANAGVCENKVAVELQRRKPGRVPFRTFSRKTSNGTGGFSLTFKPASTFLYRALVRQTDQCLGAASDRERVGVTRQKATKARRARH
jgi:hypothetical protein